MTGRRSADERVSSKGPRGISERGGPLSPVIRRTARSHRPRAKGCGVWGKTPENRTSVNPCAFGHNGRRRGIREPGRLPRRAQPSSTEKADTVALLKYQLQQAFERSQAPLAFAPDPASMERFLALCHRRRYPNKTAIIRPGDPANTLYYVIDGSLAVCTEDEQGRELILAYINRGPVRPRCIPPASRRSRSRACWPGRRGG